MKRMKKIASLLIASCMVFGMVMSASAADIAWTETYSYDDTTDGSTTTVFPVKYNTRGGWGTAVKTVVTNGELVFSNGKTQGANVCTFLEFPEIIDLSEDATSISFSVKNTSVTAWNAKPFHIGLISEGQKNSTLITYGGYGAKIDAMTKLLSCYNNNFMMYGNEPTNANTNIATLGTLADWQNSATTELKFKYDFAKNTNTGNVVITVSKYVDNGWQSLGTSSISNLLKMKDKDNTESTGDFKVAALAIAPNVNKTSETGTWSIDDVVICHGNGVPATSITGTRTDDVTNQKISYNISVTSSEITKCYPIVALYKGTELKGIKLPTAEKTLSSTATTLQDEFAISASESDYKDYRVKLFLFDGLSSIKPLYRWEIIN